MKLKTLSTAMILATLPMTGAFAAAMDRSGQSIAAFLQPGNYFEAGISVLDADVSGTNNQLNGLGPIPGAAPQSSGDMASSYYFPSAALKLQLTDKFSFGLLYDQPFGAKAEYEARGAWSAFSAGGEGTEAEVHTENVTMLLGFQPNENWNFYAGPVYQEAKGEVSLRGAAYSALSGYDADMKKDSELGWAAGLAFQIPEIALKASLTYRSEIEHELDTTETGLPAGLPVTIPGVGTRILPLPAIVNGKTNVTTPQSVNLDLQSGIMADTVAFLNVRWVNWDGFEIRPNAFGNTLNGLAGYAGQATAIGQPALANTLASLEGGNLVEYNKDQWTVTTGVGRKFSEKWAGNVSVGWDSGAGNPVTTLGPTEGYWNVGLGLQYSPTPATFIAGGVKYFWLGDATALTVANPEVGEFEDNNAIGYGLKIGYRF
ncbi:outer membrane protein transport protein [Acinetobacter schindleri]|uniref:OmpP1/FadL family transporter n=1 Tax=Acinetobacter schindleri TaxID=108981 RepID=UPI00209B052E|nr:outer membrane protein transport protein [Acinetobacter schindleri]MCO8066648.1 outer membrane protein transport protein [Acinetobacter schindleri]